MSFGSMRLERNEASRTTARVLSRGKISTRAQETMRTIACWRGETGCGRLPGAVAIQCGSEAHCSHHMQQSLGQRHRYLVVEVPLAQKENDPIVNRGAPGWGTSNELRSSSRVEVSTTKMRP